MLRVALGLATLFVLGFTQGGAAYAQARQASSRTEPQAAGPSELDRWIPSMGVFGGFRLQDADGSISPSMLMGPQCTRIGTDCLISQEVQPSAEGDDNLRAFRAGLTVELMTPRLAKGLGNPRLFVHVDPTYIVGFDRRVTGSGDPGPMIEGDLAATATQSAEGVYSGQGTRLNAEVSPFVISAGLGMAFGFELFDYPVRVKPSVEYMHERLSVKGQVNRVVQLAQRPAPATPSDFRFIELRAVDRQNYDALGPGLEIEYDANRIGPFTITPFAAVRAYHYFGNLDITLRDENQFGESAEWKFDRDEWQWATQFGVRLRWAPE